MIRNQKLTETSTQFYKRLHVKIAGSVITLGVDGKTQDEAVRLAQDHLAAARRKTLAFGPDKTIEAKLMSDIGLRLDSHFRSNGQPRSRKDSGA